MQVAESLLQAVDDSSIYEQLDIHYRDRYAINEVRRVVWLLLYLNGKHIFELFKYLCLV